MRSPKQMLVACELEVATTDEIRDFIESTSRNAEDHDSTMFEAFNPDPRVARAKLGRFLRSHLPKFEISSEEGVGICRDELLFQIDRLLRNKTTQSEFRDFFMPLESLLTIQHNIAVNFFGDLYNACDCFDAEWNFLPNDYLLEEAVRVRQTISTEQKEGEQVGAGDAEEAV